MKVVIQRVTSASVEIEKKVHGAIQDGLVVLFGVGEHDTGEEISFLVSKIIQLRIFSDDTGKMDLSLEDINGSVLIISQFTLYGNCLKGRRPSFSHAAHPKKGEELYQNFVEAMENAIPGRVQTGIFGTDMKVSLVNDGPVTLCIEKEMTK